MAITKEEIKDKWLEEYGKFFEGKEGYGLVIDDVMEVGDFIGFPLSELLITHIDENFFNFNKEKGLYPYVLVEDKSDVSIPQDYILILQYLGDAKFLELISGKILIDNGSFIEALSSDTYNIEDFQRELDFFTKTPIDCSHIEEYGLPVSDELKVHYANTSLENQEYIENILNQIEKNAHNLMKKELGKIAAESQEEAEALMKAEAFIKRRCR